MGSDSCSRNVVPQPTGLRFPIRMENNRDEKATGLKCQSQGRSGRAETHQERSRSSMKSPKWLLSFIWIWIHAGFLINPCVGQTTTGPVTNVQAVAHKKAMLPCDINPPTLTDITILVLWYKDLGDMPIYSYDARAKPTTHSKNEALLGQRAYFRTVTETASLSIDMVTESDAGLYRCRVDFLKSPTRNSKVNLTVILPPQKPTIFDGTGRELGGTAGPFNEGQSMTLACIASGGRPPPKVTWWRGGSLLDETHKVISADGAVQNKLTSNLLSRSDLHAIFTCQATNNNMSEPVITTITVEMYFRPLEVSLLGSNQPVSAMQEIEIVCQSVGSRPSAEITWYKDGQHLKTHREEVSPNGNMTRSVLKLTPKVNDHGKSLVCRAENPKLDGSALEDTWKLAVFFVPILNLALGSNLDPKNIKEGGDVYFECKIHANPWVYKVVWLHNGVVVQHNASAGIIMSNQSLVLQRVKRASGGTYECTATNIEGEGRSNPVELSVMFRPVCKEDQKRVYGVAKGEQVEIECRVDSNPAADNFKWTFNNSAESIDVPQVRFSNANSAKLASSSVLSYIPMTELDYGSVICWATNHIGQQDIPCVYHIISSGKPDSPLNCSVQNVTSESLEIDCLEGFDGGLPQEFHVEVIDAGSPRLLSNLTSQIPFFIVSGLRPGQNLRLFIYASNKKGASEKVILEEQTIQEAEKQTAASQVDFELTPILGIGVGILCGLLVVSLGVTLAVKIRSENKRGPPLKTTKTEYRVEVTDPDEKNPDIIPSSTNTKENDYFYNSEGLTFNGPKRNGSLTDNFRNCTYYSDKSNSEITYAELCLDNTTTGSSSWSTATIDRKRRRNPMEEPPSNAVIYATIDHCRRTNGETPSHLPPHQREIVSVRVPLLVNTQQESCV